MSYSRLYVSVWFSILVAIGLALAVSASLRNAPLSPHHPDEESVELEPGQVGAGRSSKWPAVRAAYMKGHPVCEACGAKTDLEVHHVVSFHTDPILELEPANLITLCRTDHLKLGHRCDDGHTNWGKCENPNVREDAARALIQRYGPK